MNDPKYPRTMYRLPLQWGVEPVIAQSCVLIGSVAAMFLFVFFGWIFRGLLVGGGITYIIIKVAQKFNETDARFFESYWKIAFRLGGGRKIRPIAQNKKIRKIKP